MSDHDHDRIARLIQGLEDASRTLAGIGGLTRAEAERIGARFDRLTSRLAQITPAGPAVEGTD